MKKTNIKRFLPALGILIAIIAVILIIKFSSNNSEGILSGSDNVNTENIKNGNTSNVEGGAQQDFEVDNSLNVPQVDTSSTNEYVDESGSQIEEGTVEDIKAKIENKFKSIPLNRLNLNGVDLNSARIIYGEGVMSIANKDCFGFSVYVLDGEYLKNAGTFAMSIDTEVLYRYDTSTMTYIFVNMD